MQIKLEGLERTYTGTASAGDVHAVQQVSLLIPSNTIFGIIGKSGAGKSTLVRLISLLEKPDAGSIFYDGERVDNLTGQKLIQRRRRAGMIFQNFNLFSSRTAGRNIAYPMEICGMPKARIQERTQELLELVGLADRGDAPVSTLSGGQKQRVAIARALANNPDVLFCDEATSALDPQTTRAILELIRQIQKKMQLTVVMITHQMEVVRDACDEVAVLDAGRVVEQGPVSQIFSAPQAAVTRDFISNLAPMTADDDGTVTHRQGMVRWSAEGGRYILHFIGSMTGEPVLSNMAKRFDVSFNIRAGGIQLLPEQQVGTMIIDIAGDEAETANALAYLRSQGVAVEETKQ
ncbi:MAG TPA: methionine ABC transporter ATP-binding protein [Candidatus Treponema faecavium]|nr:methionine ABC transporter ATP-binding protein [Candidatus Treponema faecavium]